MDKTSLYETLEGYDGTGICPLCLEDYGQHSGGCYFGNPGIYWIERVDDSQPEKSEKVKRVEAILESGSK